MAQLPILVIGSTGKTGRRIAQRLTQAGLEVRAGSRQSHPPFDWAEPATWAPALRGAGAVYISFFPDLAVPGAPAAIEQLTALAVQAGVQRIVLLSGRGEANAERCEELVRACGRSFTLIRASWFSQNFSEGHLLEPVLAHEIALPAGEVREPFVDIDDIAEIAAAALTEERHAGKLYEVTGPEVLSFQEAATHIAKAAGFPVRYTPIPLESYRAALTEHAGAELADLLTDLCSEVLDGRNAHLGDGVQEALGRQPRSFADYCRSAAASGAWSQ